MDEATTAKKEREWCSLVTLPTDNTSTLFQHAARAVLLEIFIRFATERLQKYYAQLIFFTLQFQRELYNNYHAVKASNKSLNLCNTNL